MSQSIFIKGIFPSFSLFFTHSFGGGIPIRSRQWEIKKIIISFISNSNLLSIEWCLTMKASFLIVLLPVRHGKLLGNKRLAVATAWHLHRPALLYESLSRPKKIAVQASQPLWFLDMIYCYVAKYNWLPANQHWM